VNPHGYWVQEGAAGAGFLYPPSYIAVVSRLRGETLPLLPPRAPYLQQLLALLADKSEAAIRAVLEVCRVFPGARIVL
jgi:hypothetical protein